MKETVRKMSTSPTVTSSVRFPPTSGKTTITTSSIASRKTENTSSASSVHSKVSTGVKGASAKPSPPTTKVATSTTKVATSTTTTTTASGKAASAPDKPSPPATTRPLGAKGAFTRAKTIVGLDVSSAESSRMKQDRERIANWKRWGPYLSERQWATVREDYSPYGNW